MISNTLKSYCFRNGQEMKKSNISISLKKNCISFASITFSAARHTQQQPLLTSTQQLMRSNSTSLSILVSTFKIHAAFH